MAVDMVYEAICIALPVASRDCVCLTIQLLAVDG